jgi:hypothetical protein
MADGPPIWGRPREGDLLGSIGASLAWAGAGLVGAVLAVVVAAAVLAAAVVGSGILALTALAMRAGRARRPAEDADLIEAHHVGGHSWVAYGWRGRN